MQNSVFLGVTPTSFILAQQENTTDLDFFRM